MLMPVHILFLMLAGMILRLINISRNRAMSGWCLDCNPVSECVSIVICTFFLDRQLQAIVLDSILV